MVDYGGMISLLAAMILWMVAEGAWMPYSVWFVEGLIEGRWSAYYEVVGTIVWFLLIVTGVSLLVWGYVSYSTRLYSLIFAGFGLFWAFMTWLGYKFPRKSK